MKTKILLLILLVAGGYYYYQNYMSGYPVSPPTDQAITTEQKSYSLSDVSTHNNKDSCWVIIDKTVYDVTGFISKHPNEMILKGCGIDATELFGGVKNHFPKAQALLKQFQIGQLN